MKITGAIYRGRTSKPVFSRRGFAVDQEKRDAVVLEALGRSGQIAAIAART
jgi:2-methylaconitate cis-trans-isomerase PrpF